MISSQFLSPAGREVRLVNAEVKQILNFPNPSQQQKISTLNFAKSKSTCLIPEIVQMAFLSGLPQQKHAGRGWSRARMKLQQFITNPEDKSKNFLLLKI